MFVFVWWGGYGKLVCVEKLLRGIKGELVYMPVQGQFFVYGFGGERIFSCFVLGILFRCVQREFWTNEEVSGR